MKLKDVYIKKTPSGIIIEKEGNQISFKGRSGELIKKILEQKPNDSLLSHLISSLNQPTIGETFQERIRNIRTKKIYLFLSNDNIARKLLEFFQQLKFGNLKIFNVGIETNNFLKEEIPDYLVVYHNIPVKDFLISLNKFALGKRLRFIRAFRESNLFVIAPLVIPFETACYNCYSFLKTNNQIYDYDTLEKNEFVMGKVSFLPETISSFCANLFFLKIIQFFGQYIHHIDDLQEIVLELNNLNISYNPVLKIPNCPECGIKSSNV